MRARALNDSPGFLREPVNYNEQTQSLVRPKYDRFFYGGGGARETYTCLEHAADG